jgi:hypothetical protein
MDNLDENGSLIDALPIETYVFNSYVELLEGIPCHQVILNTTVEP